jgi:Calpain family cysteine protease
MANTKTDELNESDKAARKEEIAKAAKEEKPLGTFDYQFFAHTDYNFTAPLHGSNEGQPVMYLAGTSSEIQALAKEQALKNAQSPQQPQRQHQQQPQQTSANNSAIDFNVSERQLTDQNQATLTFPLWQIFPSRVEYANGAKVSFEYDENGDVCSITEQPGATWTRADRVDDKYYRWNRSDGKAFALDVHVLPDGNYQFLNQNGNVNTFTTTGKMYQAKPFSSNFDIRQSVVRVYRQLNKRDDGLLSKAELNQGVSYQWRNEDDAQLVAMMKVHFELIQILRDKAIMKIGRGISMEDVLNYDDRMRQLFKSEASPASMKTIEKLFDAVDSDSDQNISLSELKEKISQQKLTSAQKSSFNYILLHTEKLHAFTPGGYVDRTERMTKNEFLAHYAQVYHQEVGRFMHDGGWGLEKVWRKTMEANRSLYADLNKPEESIKLEAIKQGQVGDCLFLAALGSLIAVRPTAISRLITENGNNTFTVTFPGAWDTPIVVAAPTSTELTLYAKGSEYGIWAPLLEKAYGLLVAKRKNLSTVIPAENTATRENFKSIEILTGNQTRWEYTQNSFSRAFGACECTIGEGDLRKILTRCFFQKVAIMAAALKGAPTENGEPLIVQMHAYSIVKWDSQRDEVTLRNPWGVVPLNASPSDLFRLEAGKEVIDDQSEGILKLSLASFYKKFEAICIEVPANSAD